MSEVGAVVDVCRDIDEYIARAGVWRPGSPFPVLDGPQLDRYRSVFPAGGLPRVAVTPRPGVVLSVGPPVSAAAGRLLALATARPHSHVPPSELSEALDRARGGLVAVVGTVEALTAAGDWPGARADLVGVLTGRSEAALSCLVFRTVTVDAIPSDQVFTVSHPLMEGADRADAASLAELETVRREHVKVLVLRGQGRECCFGLMDSMVCGREDSMYLPVLPADPDQRATPCMSGRGCFRTDLTQDELVPAADLRATLVLAHSCSSIAVGANAYPHRIALALGLLEGTAVAVVGALGVHVAQLGTASDFVAAIDADLPLGEITRQLAVRSQPLGGALVRFGLLGDPGLTMPWRDRTAITALGARARLEPPDHRDLDRLAAIEQVMARLERLRWLDIALPEQELLGLRERLRATCAEPNDPRAGERAGEIETDLAELQRQMVASLTEHIYTTGWNFGGSAFATLRQHSESPTDCPNCGTARATLIELRHRIEPELRVSTLQCRRCGDIWWSTGPVDTALRWEGPVDVTAVPEEPVAVERTLVNDSDRVVRGAIGYAFRSRRYLGLPPGWSEPLLLKPGGRHLFRHDVDLVSYSPQPDTHTTPVVAIADGIYAASMVMLRLG
ncbi:hypothetical protein [Longispora urticae]